MIVQAVRADGSIREMVVENGARVILGLEERLIVVADPGQARMTSQPDGLTTIVLKGFGEFSVQVAGDISLEPTGGPVVGEPATAGAPRPVIIFATQDLQSEGGSVTMEPLGIHESSVKNTDFLDRQAAANLGMGQMIELAAYDADEVGGIDGPAFGGGNEQDPPGERVSQETRGQDSSQPHPPVITGDVTGAVTEDAGVVAGNISANGKLTAMDPDPGESGFTTGAVTGAYGELSIDADGNWTYTADNSQAAIQSLGAGDTLTDSFTVYTLDGTPQTIDIIISGTGDAPVITGDLLGEVVDTVEYTVTVDDLKATDIDVADTLTYTVTAPPTRGVLKLNGSALAVGSTFTQSDISSGHLTFAFSVIASGSVQSFKTDTFAFTLSDGTYTSAENTFTFENSATIVIGTDAADDLTPYVGDASQTYHVYGMIGDDTLAGNAGGDTLDGGLGSDTADYSAAVASVIVDLSGPTDTAVSVGTDTLVGIENAIGSDHDDVFIGDENNNTFMGGAGNDSLSGFGGNDSLFGGAGLDTLDGGDGEDILEGGAGGDSLVGGDGTDAASYSASNAGVTVNLGTGLASGGDAQGDTLLGIENLIGSAYNDSLTGKFGANNQLFGGDGNDSLDGSLGADTLDGGDGIDTVYYNVGTAGAVNVNLETGIGSGGNAEGDRYVSIENVVGSGGNDTLIGDDNANLLRGLTGNDTIDGGGGDDTLEGGGGADYLVGGAGIDTATFRISSTGTGVNVSLVAGVVGIGGDAQGDTLMGIENLAGTNFADTLAGNEEANVFDGGGGFDTVSYSASGAGVNVNLGTGAVSGGHAAGDTLTGIENLIGSAHDDTLIGSGGNNVLEGGAGADYLDGGVGTDTASYSASSAGVNVNLATGVGLDGDAQGDTLLGIENLFGSAYDDILSGNSLANVLDGGVGNDTLYGGTGVDTLLGGDGDDVLRFSLDTPGLLDGLNTVQADKVGLLDGGSGTDSLVLDGHAGTGVTLDLTALVGAGKVTGMEKINITGDADDQNTLRLSASDVLDMSDTDILFVNGNGDDTVDSSDWINNGTVTLDGQNYTHYSATVGADTVHLYVDVDILDQTIS